MSTRDTIGLDWTVPFRRGPSEADELRDVLHVLSSGSLESSDRFVESCAWWLKQYLPATELALMTSSGTRALELAALLADLSDGDEVIVPSFAYVTTASAFAVRGAVPVFIDIHPNTLTIDPYLIEQAITRRTRAVVVVHYAGVAGDLDEIDAICRRHGLLLIEDAAQAILASYKGRGLGTIGPMGTFSFSVSRNVLYGRGGALLVNDPDLVARAERIRDRGTNHREYVQGLVDRETWSELGSCFSISELSAAFLEAQLERAPAALAERVQAWTTYHQLLASLEERGLLRRPVIPPEVEHNGDTYYILVASRDLRSRVLAEMQADGIQAMFHYDPLHNSPAGLQYGRTGSSMNITEDVAERIIRLPLWDGIPATTIQRVVDSLEDAIVGTADGAETGRRRLVPEPIRRRRL